MEETRKASLRWLLFTGGSVLILLVFLASLTVVFDPYFHYHAPLKGFSYELINERYQNDGIVRHFDYDTIIAGTSMVENFKTTECDAVFDCRAIKVPFSGSAYMEVDENLYRAFEANDSIRYVIRGLDTNKLNKDKDYVRYDSYPTYLTNNNPFDDVKYVLNKDTLLTGTARVLYKTLLGFESTTFDSYGYWGDRYTFGREAVLTYDVIDKAEQEIVLNELDKTRIRENLMQNVTELPQKHPETTFYYFFTPYSICWWDTMNMANSIRANIETQRIAIETILSVPNIKLFSFFTNYEMICNFDNYKDTAHYGEWVNTWMLQWMKHDAYLLTADNYEEYLSDIETFYTNYDYTALHEG